MAVIGKIFRSSFFHLVSFLIIFALFFIFAKNNIGPFNVFLSDNKIVKEIPIVKTESIKIANWNLQVFGDAKAPKENLMKFYSETIKDYDIIFLQEIRDFDNSAFEKLCSMVPDFDCLVSSRAGRISSKEQYGIVFKKGIEVSIKDFNPDRLSRWERPPIMAKIKTGNYSLSAYNIHIKPDSVKKEIANLEDLVENKGNVIVLGDFNADCDYYNVNKRNEFLSWRWVIKDDDDTTVSALNCAYDRVIINEDAFNEHIRSGIFSEGINSGISDHYLVWTEIKIN